MNQKETIGAHIRSLRTAKKLTLKQLSEQSGLSVGFLSQLERGMSSVAIDTLTTLADILGISLSSFFDLPGEPEPDPVVHGFDLRSSAISPQIIQHVLSHDITGYEMLPRLFTLLPMPGPEEQLEMYTHEGEEFIYVLEGIVTVFLDGRNYTLYPGDSIQIHSAAPHNWTNTTNKIARILQVNRPNPFIDNAAHHNG